MVPSCNIKVIHYDSNHVDNPYPGGNLPWHVYHTVRNEIFRICRKHGPTGPMAECPISYNQGIDNPYGIEGWPVGDHPCDYFLVDDQYGHERYLYLEIYSTEKLSLPWLYDIIQALQRYPGWGIGIKNIDKGFLLIFPDKLMVNGPVFTKCKSIHSVLKAAKRNLGGTPEWNQRQARKEKWRKAIDKHLLWAGVGACMVVTFLLAVCFSLKAHSYLAACTILLGTVSSFWIWFYTSIKRKRRRLIGKWVCRIGGEERCIELDDDNEMATVTAHGGCITSMTYHIDWKNTPPRLTLRYLAFTGHDETHVPLEPFDEHEVLEPVSIWTTTYAFRFLSNSKLQLAPPDTIFSTSDAMKYPVYIRDESQ